MTLCDLQLEGKMKRCETECVLHEYMSQHIQSDALTSSSQVARGFRNLSLDYLKILCGRFNASCLQRAMRYATTLGTTEEETE